MSDFNHNPKGLGGFKPGETGNAGGRLRAQSRSQLWFLKYTQEMGEILLQLARKAEGTKAEQIRLAAVREMLDRGIGKPAQGVDLAMDLSVNKKLNEMSAEELVEFKQRYLAATSAAPAVIERVLQDDDEGADRQPELFADEADGTGLSG
jgi:hypothetical protein